MADSQMTVRTQRARFVATRCMKPNLAKRPKRSTMTVELTKRKCICRKVKSACSMEVTVSIAHNNSIKMYDTKNHKGTWRIG